MIKLNRGECPAELTDEVRAELTRLYAENRDKDVWNSPKIKKPLKEALLLNAEVYIKVKEILKANAEWTDKLENIEQDMKMIALHIV